MTITDVAVACRRDINYRETEFDRYNENMIDGRWMNILTATFTVSWNRVGFLPAWTICRKHHLKNSVDDWQRSHNVKFVFIVCLHADYKAMEYLNGKLLQGKCCKRCRSRPFSLEATPTEVVRLGSSVWWWREGKGDIQTVNSVS